MADLILEKLDEMLAVADVVTLSELSTIIQHAYHRTPDTMRDTFRRAINFEYMGTWILASIVRSGSIFIDFASVASTLVVAHHNIIQLENDHNLKSSLLAPLTILLASGVFGLVSVVNHASPDRTHAQKTLDNVYIKSAIDVFSQETDNLRIGQTESANLTILWDSAKKLLLQQQDGHVYSMLTYADLAVDLIELKEEYVAAKLNI
jgi:hypothetical protein